MSAVEVHQSPGLATAEQGPDPAQLGLEMLQSLGLNEEQSARLGAIQLNAGQNCVGDLATFMGHERHAGPARDAVVKQITQGVEGGKGFKEIEDIVVDKLDVFIARDAEGQILRQLPQTEDDVKKN